MNHQEAVYYRRVGRAFRRVHLGEPIATASVPFDLDRAIVELQRIYADGHAKLQRIHEQGLQRLADIADAPIPQLDQQGATRALTDLCMELEREWQAAQAHHYAVFGLERRAQQAREVLLDLARFSSEHQRAITGGGGQ